MKPWFKRLNSTWLAAAVSLSAMGLTTSNAEACGGFFCNNQDPTVQTGEKILFAVEDDNIRAYVQVFYDGPADDFAWIIPVASNPDVGVGTDLVFNVLEANTNPYFQIDMKVDDSCYDLGIYPNIDMMLGGAENDSSPSGTDGGDFVNVVAEGDAGPYNYVTLESNNSDVLVAWLNENDYAQPPSALPLIEHYVANEMLFVAVKLQPGKDVGDIAPIVLDFKEQNPCVPLVLTQVAATPDMPVKVFLLGDKRAVPTNWLHVSVNEKKLDWFSLQNNGWGGPLESYEAVLSEAIAEAEGHAFTTEYAGSSELMKNKLDNGQFDNVSDLLSYTNADEFMEAVQNYFSGSADLLNILRKHLPTPDGIDEQDFYNWPGQYSEEYAALDADLDALYAELVDVLVTPMIEAQEMFDKHPYLTRLYSKVSIESMDRDPIFEFQDGEDVSNQHKAILNMTCEDGKVSYHMELENGETFVPEAPEYWNLPENASSPDDVSVLPSAERIELFGTDIAPRVVAPEYAEYVDEQLDMTPSQNVDVPEAPAIPETTAVASGRGCSATGSESGSTHLAFGVLMMGLALLRRREASLQ